MQRPDSLKKTLMLGKMEGHRRRAMKCLHCITSSVGMNLSKLQETVIDREAWRTTVNEAAKSLTQLGTITVLMLVF